MHRSTRRGIAVALAFTLAALFAAVAHRTDWWLPLHLFLAVGLLSDTHDVADVDTWLEFKSERADAVSASV